MSPDVFQAFLDRPFRFMFEHNPDPMWIYDQNLRIIAVNTAAVRVYGYSEEEFLRMSVFDMRPPEEIQKFIDFKATRSPIGSSSGPWKHRRKDGSVLMVEVFAQPFDAGGEKATLVHVKNVTDRYRLEERLKLIFDNVTDIFFLVDVLGDGHFQFSEVNNNFLAVTGLARDAVIGKLVHEVIPQPALGTVLENYRETVRTRRPIRWTETSEYPSGTKHGEVSIAPVLDQCGHVAQIVGVVRDITERRSMEAQMAQMQKMEALGRLASGIAHDFNNIMGVISLSVDMLLSSNLQLDDKSRGILEGMAEAVEQGSALPRQLLLFSRGQQVTLEQLDMNSVILGVQSILARAVGQNVQIALNLADSLPMVLGDRPQLGQVFMNLALNARDAMPDGGTLTIETSLIDIDSVYSVDQVGVLTGRQVLVVVSDTGAGMTKEVLAKAFEPFFTTKSKGKGTGLGLPNVFSIVRRLGGRIWIYSEPGKGTSVKMYFPVVVREEKPAPAVQAIQRGGAESILVVDDEHGLRTLIGNVLRKNGYCVDMAGSAEEAVRVAFARNPPFDLVVLDLTLPDGSGIEVGAKLLELRPAPRILFVSGYSESTPDLVGHGELQPGCGFLGKPFYPGALVAKVRELLDTPRQEETAGPVE